MGNSNTKSGNFLAVKAFIGRCELEVLTDRNLDSTTVFSESDEELRETIRMNNEMILEMRNEKRRASAKDVLDQINRKLNMSLESFEE